MSVAGGAATGPVWSSSEDSEMSKLLSTLDWEFTPLGDPRGWPEALRRTVRDAMEPFSATLPSEPQRLVLLRGALHSWLAGIGVARRTAEEIVLAVNEACSNAMEHAHRFDARGVCTVAATVLPGAVEVSVGDTGQWRPPGSSSAHRGRGLLLMKLLMDDVTVIQGDTGTVVRLRKVLP